MKTSDLLRENKISPKSRPKTLLNIDANAKTVKGQAHGYMTAILYLAPAKLSGYEVCPQRSDGCTNACLNTAGMGVFPKVQLSRVNKTKWFFEDRDSFMDRLTIELAKFKFKAHDAGLTPVVRLNGTSDIAWENIRYGGKSNLMACSPSTQFYDYTKVTKRALKFTNNKMPDNYHLTFSLNEDNDRAAKNVLRSGGSVAAVFKDMPDKYMGVDVVNGDHTDLRFLDPLGVIIGLKAKGKARKDTSGFVR